MKIPPYPVLTKRTEEVPNWLPVVTSVGAVLMAFIISGIILKLIGADPIKVYRYFFKASFGSWGRFFGCARKSHPPSDPDRLGLRPCLPHAALEYWC